MNRLPQWRINYENLIDDIRRKPFAWGYMDCLAGLVDPAVQALTGEEPFFRFRARYKTAKGALGVMRRSGFENLADLVASELPEIHPSMCVVGDIVAIPTDDDFAYALGVVNGDRVFVISPNGLSTRDISEAVRAFKVG